MEQPPARGASKQVAAVGPSASAPLDVLLDESIAPLAALLLGGDDASGDGVREDDASHHEPAANIDAIAAAAGNVVAARIQAWISNRTAKPT
jgi:hypothetical protein